LSEKSREMLSEERRNMIAQWNDEEEAKNKEQQN